MIKTTKRSNRQNIGLIACILVRNRSLAWNVHETPKETCFVFPTRWHERTHIRTPLFFSATNSNENKDDDNLHSSLGAKGNKNDFAGLYGNKSDEGSSQEGILLDSQAYLQADALVQSDGSFSLDFNPIRPQPNMKNPLYKSAADRLLTAPPHPFTNNDQLVNANDQRSSPNQQLTDEEMLLQAMANINNKSQRIDPELLHQQVFADEEAYLRQSEEFRKSLTTLYDDGKESPMSKARREAIEIYNQGVLDSLLKDIDEMEEMALTREEAMKQAKRESPLSEQALCCKCGCKVTPDVIERFQKIRMAQEDATSQTQHRKLDMLCDACYGSRFRSSNEAVTRLGAGQFGESSSAKMWDKRTHRPRRSEEQGMWESSLNSLSFLSSPKKYDATEQHESNPQNDAARRQKIAQPSRELRSRDLTRQNIQRQSEIGLDVVKQEEISEKYRARMRQRKIPEENDGEAITIREVRSNASSYQVRKSDDTSGENEEWVKVSDEKSKRMFYWNKTTGEMRKRPPD